MAGEKVFPQWAKLKPKVKGGNLYPFFRIN